MNILITGSKGFLGRNLMEILKNIKEGKDKRYDLNIEKIYEYDIGNTMEELDAYCAECDFVFHLAGVNRPKNIAEFMTGNVALGEKLLNALERHQNRSPIVISSSIQATLIDRYEQSAYGQSKLAEENLMYMYSAEMKTEIYVYRFPNIFGKWCRPNYNSVIATFCYNVANDLPIQIEDRNRKLELVYIDDVLDELLLALLGKPHRCDYEGMLPISNVRGKYCYVPVTYKVRLGEVADLLYKFCNQPKTLLMPEIQMGSFEKKLYSTYLSYLPKKKILFPIEMKVDSRGSFSELMRTEKCGQWSVNVLNPGVTKGQHWHNTKWELFIVVSGHGLIQERQIGTDEVIKFEVFGNKLEVVHILPGYTHSISNLSDTENLVTIMWANEQFDEEHPDTFKEKV